MKQQQRKHLSNLCNTASGWTAIPRLVARQQQKKKAKNKLTILTRAAEREFENDLLDQI